jgi:hypothetical protein
MLHIVTHASQPLEAGQKNISTFFGGPLETAINTADDADSKAAPKENIPSELFKL